jgi:hypothetical protein
MYRVSLSEKNDMLRRLCRSMARSHKKNRSVATLGESRHGIGSRYREKGDREWSVGHHRESETSRAICSKAGHTRARYIGIVDSKV